MPSKPPLKIILGTASVGSSIINSADAVDLFVQSFRVRGYADIDTAWAYPVGTPKRCERLLGQDSIALHTWANVSTKASSFYPGAHNGKNITKSISESLRDLHVPSVDVFYLHAPDRGTPFLDTCIAVDQAYRQGQFERFGLSNYSAAEVEQIVSLCDEHHLVRPSVYQGQYNPLCRDAEADLFSVLRTHRIAFCAYSPSAGGFFLGDASWKRENTCSGRWDIRSPLGAKYRADYFHDELFAAADLVNKRAEELGTTGHAVALRWTTYHSCLAAELGDALIVGASTQVQLEQNLDILEAGPLDPSLVKVVDRVWDDIRAWKRKTPKKIGPHFALI